MAALIGLVAGAVSGFATAAITNQFERRRVIDDAVRDVRLRRYAVLWNATSLFPLWPRATVTTEQVWTLSAQLRAWYFGGYPHDRATATPAEGSDAEHPGGMYLSTEARQAYTGVQESLKAVLEKPALAGALAGELRTLDDGDYDAAREACQRVAHRTHC